VAKMCGSNPMPVIHSATSRAYCRVVMASPTRRRLVKQKFAWHLAGRLEVVVNGLARLLRQLEADWTPGLSLAHRGTGEGISARGSVFDLHRDDIAASQLAINGEIEHCQVAGSPFGGLGDR